jgi:hypothetical protein
LKRAINENKSGGYLDLMQDEEDAMGAIVGASTEASDRSDPGAPGPGSAK